MPHAGDHRNFRGAYRPRDDLLVKRPEILDRAAAAPAEDHVGLALPVELFKRVNNLARRARALHRGRREQNRYVGIAPPGHAHNVAQHRAGARRRHADHARIGGNFLFNGLIEQPLGGQPALERLKAHVQFAHALALHRLHIELKLSALGIERRAAPDRHALPVLRPEIERLRRRAEHHARHARFLVLEREVEMSAGVALKAGNLALHAQRAQHGVAGQQPPDVLVELRDAQRPVSVHAFQPRPACFSSAWRWSSGRRRRARV